MRQQRTIHIFVLLAALVLGVGQVWGVEQTITYKDVLGNDSLVTYNVVYINLGNGEDSKAGDSPANAVKSWSTAYGKLPKYTGTTDADRDAAWDSNIIVVCDKSGQLNITDGNTSKRPATITGAWPWVDSKGNSPVPSTIQGKVNLSSSPRIGADTKFKYLNFGQGMLSMYLHDCTFDVGCFMNGISSDLTAENGALRVEGDVSRAPEFQVFLYANSQNFDPSKPTGGLPTQTKPVTLTIKSGKFGRILTNRLTGVTAEDVKKKYVMGRPNSPFLCVVNVDIDPNTSTGDWNTRDDVYDIAYLCAGMTQGMVYSDVQFNIKRGTIGTLVAAMQGNSHTATATVGISNSSFFGRTEVNINPVQNEDVTIYRYFATCFGRYTENANTKGTSNAAFYGKSTLNMHGGTIESGVFATAGGIAGLKSPDGAYHTTDKFIPYLDEGADYVNYPFMGIKYQAYDETGKKKMPTFTTTLHGTPETIDLSETVTEINIYGGTVNGGVFGGGYGFSPEMPTERAIAGAGSFWGETRVNIYGGTITGGVYGGGMGASNYFNASSDTQRNGFSTVASVYGDTHVNIYGGDISGDIYGGGKGLDSQKAANNQKIWDGATEKTVKFIETEFADVAKVYGTTNVTINPTDPSWTFEGNIYGGGALGSVEGTTNVKVLGGNITGNVFAGGLGEDGHADKAKVTGNTEANIKGGSQGSEYAVYGGAQMAQVVGNTTVNLTGGTVGSAYGGGLGTETMAANITGNTQVNLGAMEDDGEGNLIATGNATVNNIFGCNNLNGTPSGTDTVNVISGTVNNNVYGGGNQANASVSPVVNIKGGIVTNDVYGGGALADVTGNTTVNLTGGTIGNSYGGGLGSNEVAALVGGNATTTLNGSKVTGSIFGANNVNGTPNGHVKVHVLSTAKREEQADDAYDVAAVYGGGNQAAYEPSQATFDANKGYTEVLIENCDNSIEYVYGGGNAAPVPATDVKIYGANAINDAFAGGNGAGAGNPGADIGYNGYYSQTGGETPTYGTGITRITVYGGTVNNVFGGSNTLGYVREHAYASVLERPNDYTGAECDLKVGEVYGAGNKAEMYCPSTMEMACSAGADAIYGGAKQVNFYGDVTLNIVSGTYGKVFGGNNMSGNVLGKITINVDETGCFPVKIGELYGCGNKAAYSVYGYNDDGSIKTEGTKQYADPTINLISFTEIGKVFGGGLGESAVMYGNPTININPIKGEFAGKDDIPDAVGTIGTIYGGGNEAAVYGNTNVNIATKATNKHLTLGAEEETVDAIITGNVYGGGSKADVHGNTNVTIGK